MTPTQLEALKYRDYPEGSGGKAIYDSVFLPFQEYLIKYYKNPDLGAWMRWKEKYIDLAFDENRRDEMARNFGYVEKTFHNFELQNEAYQKTKQNKNLDEDLRKFIAFMAGVGFFKNFGISVEEWIDMNNWSNPNIQRVERKNIKEILSYEYGVNYLKARLPHLDYWKR